MLTFKRTILLVVTVLILSACAAQTASPTAVNTDWYDKVPDGQAPFPTLSTYWVADAANCFSTAAKQNAFNVFDKLRIDHVAEVAVVCQKGVTEVGGGPQIWLRNWARNQKIGNIKDQRGLVFLIRPDVAPEANRVILTKSTHLYYFTEVEWDPIMQLAAKYANANRFDQALESIVSMVDSALRKQAPQYPTTTP